MLEVEKIEVKNIYKEFKQGDKYFKVLDNFNYIFYSNLTYAICGVSGSGKSTLLYILSGLIKPSSGAIYFNNNNISMFTDKQSQEYLNRDIGIVFQQPYLLKELSVIENIMLKGLIYNFDFNKSYKQAKQLLEDINLIDKANVATGILSGGEQQRVAIARALFNQPKFLIADEPTAHLDPENRENIINLLLKLKSAYNIGLIIATHDNNVAKKLDVKINIVN